MKPYFAFILCFSLSISKHFGQFLPTLGTTIDYKGRLDMLFLEKQRDTSYQISFKKDTIINNISCLELKWTYRACDIYPQTIYLYEQDSVVYFLNKTISEDFQILYDFSAKKNDSWKVILNQNSWVIVTVDSTYNTELLGDKYKMMNVTYSNYYQSPNASSPYLERKRSSKIIEKMGDLQFYYPYRIPYIDCVGEDVILNFEKYTSDNTTLTCEDAYFMYCNQIGVGIFKNQNQKNLSIYPTTTATYLQIETELIPISIEVFDASGNKMTVNQNDKTLDVSGLKAGIYFLQVYTADGQMNSSKFVKE